MESGRASELESEYHNELYMETCPIDFLTLAHKSFKREPKQYSMRRLSVYPLAMGSRRYHILDMSIEPVFGLYNQKDKRESLSILK